MGFFWILLKKVLVVLVVLVDSVSSVVLVITFHVIRQFCVCWVSAICNTRRYCCVTSRIKKSLGSAKCEGQGNATFANTCIWSHSALKNRQRLQKATYICKDLIKQCTYYNIRVLICINQHLMELAVILPPLHFNFFGLGFLPFLQLTLHLLAPALHLPKLTFGPNAELRAASLIPQKPPADGGLTGTEPHEIGVPALSF